MTRLSNAGTQRIPQKVLAFSREVDECKPLSVGGAAAPPRGAALGGADVGWRPRLVERQLTGYENPNRNQKSTITRRRHDLDGGLGGQLPLSYNLWEAG